MQHLAFQDGCIHAENVGGDIDQVLNQRCVIGAFPWKIEGGEACPCRIMAFFDIGSTEVAEGLGAGASDAGPGAGAPGAAAAGS